MAYDDYIKDDELDLKDANPRVKAILFSLKRGDLKDDKTGRVTGQWANCHLIGISSEGLSIGLVKAKVEPMVYADMIEHTSVIDPQSGQQLFAPALFDIEFVSVKGGRTPDGRELGATMKIVGAKFLSPFNSEVIKAGIYAYRSNSRSNSRSDSTYTAAAA